MTRVAYDLVAEDYARLLEDSLGSNAWDRAVLAAFAAEVLADGGGAVADLGCGPGRLTGHLSELGLEVFGLDLSPRMIDVARRTHPDLPFGVGSTSALPVGDDLLGGIVAWYSMIHTPPDEQPAIYQEFARVLRRGGHLVLAFQIGDECVHLSEAYGHRLDLDVHRLSPGRVAGQLVDAGFAVTAELLREPRGPERQRQGYLVARSSTKHVREARTIT